MIGIGGCVDGYGGNFKDGEQDGDQVKGGEHHQVNLFVVRVMMVIKREENITG